MRWHFNHNEKNKKKLFCPKSQPKNWEKKDERQNFTNLNKWNKYEMFKNNLLTNNNETN